MFGAPIKSYSGKRATHAWPCCEPSWMRYLRREVISLLPEEMSSISSLKPTYVPLWIVYCFYSMYFIIGMIVKFLLQQCLQLSSTCLGVAMWTSRAEAVVYVVRRRSLWFSDDSEYLWRIAGRKEWKWQICSLHRNKLNFLKRCEAAWVSLR